MDVEYDKIKKIRNNLSLEVNEVPTSFFFRDKTHFRNSIIEYLNEFVIDNRKRNVNGCIENLILIIYSILDILVEQGIYPDSLLDLMIFDDLQKIWPDKNIHYDNKGLKVYPDSYESISGRIDKEILSMKDGSYKKQNISIGKHYNDIVNYYKISNQNYSEEPVCIADKNAVEYQFGICFELDNYAGCCDYVEEEAECLINCLYRTLKVCVEMGFNPEKNLDELIDRMQSKFKGKSK